MRGLSAGRTLGGTGSTAGAASATVVVFVALGVFLSGCGAGGARDEGPAHAEAVGGVASASPVATPSGVPDRVDAVRLVKSDPRVSAAVKRGLKPCVADEYPVDVSYGDLTDGEAQDVVVNVLTCGDAVGVGSYVYREQDGGYRNVFRSEEPPVYAEIDRGDLVVTQQVYERGDPVSDPSGENVITYRWSADHFTEEHRTHNDYSNSVGVAPSPVPAP
ncbi:hypothetical protein [Streptomyces sp. NRRL F-5065]|uniref:hypothetical protein n=1 Tax=unclassified Streptomyces TaxID=2593676 RepID=UPI0004C2A25E